MSASKDHLTETNVLDTMKRLNDEIIALEKKHAELTASVLKTKAEKTRQLAELQQVQPELKKLKNEQRSLEDAHKRLKQSSIELEKRISESKTNLLKREENLRKVEKALETATSALQSTANKQSELDNLLESLRHAVTEKEERLTLLQEHWEDLDKRYTHLASMPESDPTAFAEWREMEKQKESFLARIIPKGILARPATRITVVPRGNS